MHYCSNCEIGILDRYQVMADPKKNGRIRFFIRRAPANAELGYCKPCATTIKQNAERENAAARGITSDLE